MAVRAPRLPGFRFESPPPRISEVLPRMDIAVFVGFAASGPPHLPVVVEDQAAFSNIFGRDIPLAQDSQSGELLYAHLGPAVRGFFRNGGRRCWVIRVADSTASTNRFPVVGLIAFDPSTRRWTQAYVDARSPGSWSDGIRVGGALLGDPVHVTGMSHGIGATTLEVSAPTNLSVGDLVCLTIPPAGLELMLPVDKVEDGAVSGRRALWFASTAPPSEPGAPLGAWLFDGTLEPAELPVVVSTPTIDGRVRLELALHVREAPIVGSLIRHTVGVATSWLTVDSVEPASNREHALLSGPAQWYQASAPSPLPDPKQGFGTRLSFQMRARLDFERWPGQAASYPLQLDDLAFGQGHPRFWGDLPCDRRLYAVDDESHLRDHPEGVELWQQASLPRFPMSGPSEAAQLVFLPLAMRDDPEILGFKAPTLDGRTELERDGLGTYSAQLFVDRDLSDAGVESLATQADYIRYQAPLPRALRGIHASIGLGEPVLIATPDAGHLGWQLETHTPPPAPPPPPPLPAPPPAACEPPFVDPETPGVFADCSRIAEPPLQPGAPAAPTENIRVWRTVHPRDYDPSVLRAVHAAMLTMCAATSDLFGVLSLPPHYREDAALEHTAWLRSTSTEADRTLSFGAVYHPWLIESDARVGGDLRKVPPDGVACGVMARRALQVGAWIAPANTPLSGVVALTPLLHSQRRLDLQEGRVNVVRQDPRGFLVLCADTLSPDDTLRPINVRRLLMLLRRLAEREGASYVFEPNDAEFRRTVERGFESVLDDLYARGALAGATADAAYLVDAGPMLNTARTTDAGQFIVELRVAPSRPLTFVTIRLVQTGSGLFTLLERTA
jgi:hypothetical protein